MKLSTMKIKWDWYWFNQGKQKLLIWRITFYCNSEEIVGGSIHPFHLFISIYKHTNTFEHVISLNQCMVWLSCRSVSQGDNWYRHAIYATVSLKHKLIKCTKLSSYSICRNVIGQRYPSNVSDILSNLSYR